MGGQGARPELGGVEPDAGAQSLGRFASSRRVRPEPRGHGGVRRVEFSLVVRGPEKAHGPVDRRRRERIIDNGRNSRRGLRLRRLRCLRGKAIARANRRRSHQKRRSVRSGDARAEPTHRDRQPADEEPETFQSRGAAQGQRVHEMAKSARARARGVEQNRVERGEIFHAEGRERRRRGEGHARRIALADHERGAARRRGREGPAREELGEKPGSEGVRCGGFHGPLHI